ncbi:hypothetical protein [Tenacibaculum litopenaei]
MKLPSLQSFEVLSKETIRIVSGGSFDAPSKKRDYTSTNRLDSSKTDAMN